jgi:mRNA-degrading endonuclease toxin of MazEF toxin-antitoxin module
MSSERVRFECAPPVKKLTTRLQFDTPNVQPCVVVSPDEREEHLRTVIVAPLATGGHAYLWRLRCRFQGRAGFVVALDQLRTVDAERLVRRLGQLAGETVRPCWNACRRCSPNGELRAKLRASNAQTPPKTGEHQRPESKTNQQDREPRESCETSIPGSNPGGASKFPVRIQRSRHSCLAQRACNCSRMFSNSAIAATRRSPKWQNPLHLYVWLNAWMEI